MQILVDKKDLHEFQGKMWNWFYACLNEVVPKMLDRADFNLHTDRDYRDRCARMIREYREKNPPPDWQKDL